MIAFFSHVLSGAALIALTYAGVELYRQKAAYQNAYLERRLERLGSLWTATDRHGAEVLKLLGSEKVDAKSLKALGESYYKDLESAGLYLGTERMESLRNRVGDIFIREQDSGIRSENTNARAEAIRTFRRNWLDVLEELEALGEKSGR